MKLRFVVLSLLILLASSVSAQDLGIQIAQQLRQQGYEEITVSKTLLRRVRVEASKDGALREIIVNPRTGEILRDFQTSEDGRAQIVVKILDKFSFLGDGTDSDDTSTEPQEGYDRGPGGAPAGPAPSGAKGAKQ